MSTANGGNDAVATPPHLAANTAPKPAVNAALKPADITVADITVADIASGKIMATAGQTKDQLPDWFTNRTKSRQT